MSDWRREPFRVFFPLGLVLGGSGILPWILFGRGQMPWPGVAHALTMTQSFLVALAVGFLGTLLPRRAKCEPLSWIELATMGLALTVLPVAAHKGSLVIAELSFLIVLATLGQFVVRALRGRRAGARPAPPSFVLLPLGVLLGVTGALLIIYASVTGAPWALALGRPLAQQGLMLGLLLALVPLLAPILAHGNAPADPPEGGRATQRSLHLFAGLLLAASFPLELWVSPRLGLLLRGAVCAAELVVAGGLYRAATAPGLHRWFFRLALWSVPLGLLAAGLTPDKKVQLAHVTYVGGLSLVAFAISAHVAMLHTGADEMASRRPLLVGLAGGLTLAAAVVRVGAEGLGPLYMSALSLAAGLWVAAALAWAIFLAARFVPRAAR